MATNHNPRGIRRHPRIDEYMRIFTTAIRDGLAIEDALRITLESAGFQPKPQRSKASLAKEILRAGCEFYGVSVGEIIIIPRLGRRPPKDFNRRMSIIHAMRIAAISKAESQRVMGYSSHQPICHALDLVELEKYREQREAGEEIYRRAISREFLESEVTNGRE